MAKSKKLPKVILLVDDELSVLQLVKGILESEGYSVSPAVSGEQAFHRLAEIKPNLVILDMMMPGMSGLEVAEKMRDTPEWKDIKVMFLTVMRRTTEVEAKLKNLKIYDYIEKPFMVEDLVKRVRTACR